MIKSVAAPQYKDLDYYCKCFAKLKVSKTKERGMASHKPILILAVLELITQRSIVENRILVSDELIEIFKRYWSILVGESIYTDALHYPFVHLRSSGFWHVKFMDNGISLCKNHHWAFDLGWFSIDDNYRILVGQGLDDDSPHARSIQDFHHELIVLPDNEQHFPRLESLKWHRDNKFKP